MVTVDFHQMEMVDSGMAGLMQTVGTDDLTHSFMHYAIHSYYNTVEIQVHFIMQTFQIRINFFVVLKAKSVIDINC